MTDVTEHPTREGKVYCAVVLDVFSRRVVGWSIDHSATAGLVTSALGMAISNRQPDYETVIHSDQGTPYTWAFTDRANQSGLVPSIGCVGDCFDNALMESFWALGCRSSCWTVGVGAPVSSWPTLSSNTSRSSTTGNVGTPP